MAHLKEGDKAPLFEGKNQDGKSIGLKDFSGKKVILYFYPKDDTPGCTAEACDLRDNYNYWIKQGYEVIGISPDNEKSHLKFKQKYNLPFNLISDENAEILKAYGAWGKKNMYGKIYDGVLRTTYVIDEKGIIQEVFSKVDTKNHTAQITKKLNIS